MSFPIDEGLLSAGEILTPTGIQWAVAGGWAIDLFLGRPTREHADLDLAIWRADQEKLYAALGSDWMWEVTDNGTRRPWNAGDWLSLPIHEIHARPVAGGHPLLEFLINERNDTAWIYRRNPKIRRDLDRAILVRDSMPFLAPEIVLLYKAKAPRSTDEADFRAALPALAPEQRAWLRLAIKTGSESNFII